jgi:DNA polymerase-3 subunit delta
MGNNFLMGNNRDVQFKTILGIKTISLVGHPFLSYTESMAGKPLPAIDYLPHPEKTSPQPVCAVFGDEAFLRRQVILCLRAAVLGSDESEFSFHAFDGHSDPFRDVHEELSTVAMFGGGKRLAVVEGADEFVTRYRPQLEDYVAKPARSGVLVLDLESFPSNTRLYKAIAESGLLIDCTTPTGVKLVKWLVEWAKQTHRVQLTQSAGEMLVELIGPELGLLDQELAKLALMTGDDKKITPELIGKAVGGWRTKTTWEMLDAVLDGKVVEAMSQLDRLLASGEQPVGLLGQISASLRRFAAATRLIINAEATGRRITVRDALERAGIRSFVLQKAERQLKALGRQRGAQLYRWILQADMDLKGDSAMPPRLILERLIIRIAASANKHPGGVSATHGQTRR